MRISTPMLYEQGITTSQDRLADLIKLQKQMATGRRILEPADDPSASSRVLATTQNKSVVEQFTRNADQASSALGLHESILASAGDILEAVRTITIHAGNAGLSDADRRSLAVDLEGNYAQLLSLANTRDGSGKFMFSGFQGDTLPFTETSPGTIVYNGDQGQRLVQINASRQVPVSTPGGEVFQRIHNGNGTFVTAAASANTGTGLVDPGLVLDSTNWNASNKDFTIKFDATAATPPVITYDIVDNVTGNSLIDVTGVPAAAAGPYLRTYTSGTTISLKTQAATDTAAAFDYGAQITVSGDPATGDTFTIKASTNQDIFATIHDLIVSLQAGGSITRTAATNNNNTALSNLDLAMENILKARASVGALMKEVEGQLNTNSDLDLQYASTISNLQDLDIAKAVSDLTQKQTGLEVAQKTFLRIQGLSLFNFMQ